MNRHVAVAALLLTVGLAAPAHAADPSGVWLVQDGDAHVRIAKCGEAFCGTIVWLESPKDPTTGKPLTDVRNPDPSKRNRPLLGTMIAINFIGAAIGCMKSGSEFVLAMTGGGPYTPYGETEVIGLHIFWEAFGYLRFGEATAMAWVLGVMLVGFTVYQLQSLSRMEFKAAGGK